MDREQESSDESRPGMGERTSTSAENAVRRSDLRRRAAELRLCRVEIADLENRVRSAHHRIAALHQSVEHLRTALSRQRAEVARWTETSRLLQHAFQSIEEHFERLRESRPFRIAVYAARRLGLAPRAPRLHAEAIANEFRSTRKALKLAQETNDEESGAAVTPPSAPPSAEPSPAEYALNAARAEATRRRKVTSARHAVGLPGYADREASVCFILAQQAGVDDQRPFFQSFLNVNTHRRAEFIVASRGCKDGSSEAIQEFRDRLRIRIIDFPDVQSVPCLNNRAAAETEAEYLVFLSSRILFREEITGELLRCLQGRLVGLAGVRLMYPDEHPAFPGVLRHAGVKFKHDPPDYLPRAFCLGATAHIIDTPWIAEKVPAVTGTLVACRRRDFLAVGGFCEEYRGEYDDVDLAFSFRRRLGLRAVSANHVACVDNGVELDQFGSEEDHRQREQDLGLFMQRHGAYLLRKSLLDRITGDAFFAEEPFTIGFAVTDAAATTVAGDFFTACELAEACAKEFGWNVRYLSRTDDWYDASGVDVLVVLLEDYQLSKLRNAKPQLLKVAWLRNWFERWPEQPDFDQFDLFLCSSIKSAQWLRQMHGKPAWVFPLATNPERFRGVTPDPRFRSDYCFTGSNWQWPREITDAVQPQNLEDFRFRIFGHAWEDHPTMSAYAAGFIPYSELPRVYASTRVVVDDANHVTKGWGSVNSRVFDALAAGALVITNGEIGAAEVFDHELPTYRSTDELHALLRRYLEDENAFCELVHRLQRRVLAGHTYRHRARTLKRILIARVRNAGRAVTHG